MEEVPDLRPNAERPSFKYFEFDNELDPHDWESALGLLDNLRRKQFSLKDTGITSRVFNNWRKEGIIPESPEDGKWAYFDFPQYLWLQIVKDLRQFGLSLLAITKIKNYLFDEDFAEGSINEGNREAIRDHLHEGLEAKLGRPLDDKEVQELETGLVFLQQNSKNTFIPYCISNIILVHFMYRSETRLIITLSGQVYSWNERLEGNKAMPDEPYIVVPLNFYFSRFINDQTKAEFSRPGTPTVPAITEDEEKILKTLRSELDQEVSVKYRLKDGYQIIELTTVRGRDLPTEQAREIVERLYGNQEYSFTIKPKSGNFSYLEITKKKRIKTKKDS